MSYVPAVQDAAILLNLTTSTSGEQAAIDTTGYQTIVAQITGVWSGFVYAESSNDNSNWTPLTLIYTQSEPAPIDNIAGNGVFLIPVSSRYVRFNITGVSAPESITIVALGRTVVANQGANAIGMAMDKYNNTPLYVEPNSKQDGQKALIASDAPLLLTGSGAVLNAALLYFDTTGYQSVVIEFFGTWVANVQVVTTNGSGLPDLVQGYRANGGGGQQGSVSVNGTYIFPCIGKFIRVYIQAYTSGTVNVAAYLRNQPALNMTQTQGINLATINNTAPVTAGVAGTLAVGGNIAAGVAPTLNPVGISGVDAGGLTRRLLTDTSGRLFLAVVDPSGNIRQMNAMSPAASASNLAAIAVADQSQVEGQGWAEILAKILLELQVMNQQIFQLASGAAVPDEPGTLRDPVNFQ